ncbi:hypothetical protein MNEG_15310, partial [Monoraphidium neglectum]
MGRDGVTTGLDFGGKVNVIRLSGLGNLTLDSLALDNLFPGDEESMRGLKGMSYYTFGMYPVIWPREDRRLYLVRCTMGVPTQAEIERLKFFFSIFNSADPELQKQAAWMRSGGTPAPAPPAPRRLISLALLAAFRLAGSRRATVSELAVDQRPGLQIVMFVYKAMAMKDTYIQAANVVAPRVRFNASSNIFTAAEQAAEAAGSPLHVPPIAGILKGPEDLLVG